MRTITVTYPNGKYPIYIDTQLLRQAGAALLQHHIQGKQVMVVTNDRVAPLYLELVCQLLNGYQVDTWVIPDGECSKTLAHMSQILDALIANGHHRDTTLIALGGGVVGDLVGFAAACFHRGVHFIQIPTTLLAQVDASIGGKTAVNHPQGKNLIGAFHQPQAVFIDLSLLHSLSARHYQAGLAEIIKAALIRDAAFFATLEQNMAALMQRDMDILLDIVAQACIIKRDIVAVDEKEQNVRALLNLGHTFGHALEQNQGYTGNWLHGEAVAVGLVLAAKVSLLLGYLNDQELQRILSLLRQAHLPTQLPAESNVEQLLAAMYTDKKILANCLRLVLLNGIGHAHITSEVSDEQIKAVMQASIAEVFTEK